GQHRLQALLRRARRDGLDRRRDLGPADRQAGGRAPRAAQGEGPRGAGRGLFGGGPRSLSRVIATLEHAAELIARARKGVAFTGAGVSAESGIRTFRGEEGLWRQYDPFKVSSIDYFLQDPTAYWSVSKERYDAYRQARPNAGHVALAAMEEAGALVAV